MRVLASLGALLLLVVTGCWTDTQTVSAERSAPPLAVWPTATAVPTSVPTAVPAPTATPQPTAVPTATPEPIVERTLLFSGDVLSHTPVIGQAKRYGVDSGWAYDYRPMFADVRDRVSAADLAICVLETPISADNTGLAGYPTFNAPAELPDALVEAGYDGCATASNHSLDRGALGAKTTLDEMDRVSLGHAGMARDQLEANTPQIYDLDGVQVAHLSFTYGLNGFRLPADEPWLVNVNDADAILGEARIARSLGVDLVVLSIQWGAEYQQEPTDQQVALALELTDSGLIDLIIGNHAHVVQPVTEVNGVPVVYGLGNSLSNQSDNCCRVGTQDGVMIEATITGNDEQGFAVRGLAFAPTWVDRTNFVIVDLVKALDDPSLSEADRAVYENSFARTVEAVVSLGFELPVAS